MSLNKIKLVCLERIDADIDKKRYIDLLFEISNNAYLCGWRIPLIKKDVFIFLRR